MRARTFLVVLDDKVLDLCSDSRCVSGSEVLENKSDGRGDDLNSQNSFALSDERKAQKVAPQQVERQGKLYWSHRTERA